MRNCFSKRKRKRKQPLHSRTALQDAIDRRDWQTIREIGEGLHNVGGVKLMLDAYWHAVGDDGRAMSVLDHAWDGVGGQWYR